MKRWSLWRGVLPLLAAWVVLAVPVVAHADDELNRVYMGEYCSPGGSEGLEDYPPNVLVRTTVFRDTRTGDHILHDREDTAGCQPQQKADLWFASAPQPQPVVYAPAPPSAAPVLVSSAAPAAGCTGRQVGTWPRNADGSGHLIEAGGVGEVWLVSLNWPGRGDDAAYRGAEVTFVLYEGQSISAFSAEGTAWRYPAGCGGQVLSEAQPHAAARAAQGVRVYGVVSPRDLFARSLAGPRTGF